MRQFAGMFVALGALDATLSMFTNPANETVECESNYNDTRFRRKPGFRLKRVKIIAAFILWADDRSAAEKRYRSSSDIAP